MSHSRPPPVDESLPAEIGELIGGYRIDAVIGTGGMGCVYSATHARLGRRAAIKVLRRAYAADTDYVARFFDEARVVNAIQHPNIIDIFDFIETEQPLRVACIMALLEGQTLRQRIAKKGLSPIETANIAVQLVDAIHEVHKIGVVHRDLKPDNVFLLADSGADFSKVPSLKVLDFGIAKVQITGAERTTPGLVLGTPAYMAPEQVSGQAVSAASDVYAVGCVLYEMLAGKRLFAGEPMYIFRQKLVGEAPPMNLPEDLPALDLIRSTVLQTIAFDAKRRPSLEALKNAVVQIRDQFYSAQLVRVARPRKPAHSGSSGDPIATPPFPAARALATPIPEPPSVDTVATFGGKLTGGAVASKRAVLIALASVAGLVLATVGVMKLVHRSSSPVTVEVMQLGDTGNAPVKVVQPSTPVEAPKTVEAPKPIEAPKPVEAQKPAEAAKPAPAKPAETEISSDVDANGKKSGKKAKKAPLRKDDMTPW